MGSQLKLIELVGITVRARKLVLQCAQIRIQMVDVNAWNRSEFRYST